MVHAVLTAASPGLTIIDLTHQFPAFDVRAGRPHPGAGLAAPGSGCRPGRGRSRRGLGAGAALCLPGDASRTTGPPSSSAPTTGFWSRRRNRSERRRSPGPSSSVARADVADRGRTLRRARPLRPRRGGALCAGWHPRSWVTRSTRARWSVSPAGWSNTGAGPMGAAACGPRSSGSTTSATSSWRRPRRTPKWPSCPAPGTVDVDARRHRIRSPAGPLRRVETFAELEPGELGLLIDANGHLAVVAGEAPGRARPHRGGRAR